MFESLHIKNFRLFDEFQIDQLSRINLLAGRNNSGKTSLLEALFLLCGRGNPELLYEMNTFSGIMETKSSDGTLAAYGKSLFSNFDTNSLIEISGQHSQYGPQSLTVALKQSNTFKQVNRRANPPEEWAIQTSFKSKAEECVGHFNVTATGIETDRHALSAPIYAPFLTPWNRDQQEDAILLKQLRIRKQGDILTKALRLVEPKLRDVKDDVTVDVPMIWGDIGLPELVPLSAMGEGAAYIASLILAMASALNGVVLVDEIENGIHHSVMNKVWAVVAEAAEQFDTQVFATTHSFECFVAAHDVLDGDKWRYHRLDRTDEGVNCVTFETEDVEAAIRHGLEVR